MARTVRSLRSVPAAPSGTHVEGGRVKTYELIATDWDDTADLAELARSISPAALTWRKEARPHPTSKTPRDLWVFTYLMNADVMRNTTAHAYACRAGFVACIK